MKAVLPASAIVPSRVKAGELWQLGKHRLLCGDSRDAARVQRLMAGERARLTITSPPYNLGHSAALAGNRHLGASKYLGRDGRTREEYRSLLHAVTQNALSVSEIAVVNVQLLAGNKVALLEWLYGLREQVIDVIVWDKGHAAPAMARNILNSRFELLLLLTARRSKGRTPRTLFTADFRGTVDNVYRGSPQKRNAYFHLHAATFPLHLPLWLLQTLDSGAGASIVFDPFLGTGTTLMAAEQLGRTCYGMEIEPAYCDVILHRWEALTGRPAQLVCSPSGARPSAPLDTVSVTGQS